MVRPRRLLDRFAPKLIRDLAVLASGQIAGKLIGFAAFALLARRLSPENYGAVEYIVGLTALVATAIDCGLGTIGVRRLAAAPSETGSLAAEIPLARIALAALAIPAMVVGLREFGPPLPPGLIWLFAASLVFAAWNQDWLLQSSELMSHVAIGQTLRMVIFAFAILVFVHADADIEVVGWAELTAAAGLTVYFLVVQHARITPLRIGASLARMAKLVREAATLGLSHLVWAAAQYAPLFLVGSIVGGAEVGWFAASQRLVTSISAFSYVYHFNLYPVLARASAVGGDTLAGLLRASFRVTAWAGIGFALGIVLAASPVLALIYGTRFAIAAPTLAVLVWVVPITVLSGHARWSLIVASAQKRVLHAQIVGLVAAVAAGTALVPAFGGLGAAMAAVAGNIAVWIAAHRFAARLKAPPPPIALAARPAVLALVLGAGVEMLGLGAIANPAVGMVLYVALAAVLDRELIPDIVRLAHAKASVPPRVAEEPSTPDQI